MYAMRVTLCFEKFAIIFCNELDGTGTVNETVVPCHNLQQDERDRSSTIYRRVERRWLGGIKIPFTTIYTNGRVCL